MEFNRSTLGRYAESVYLTVVRVGRGKYPYYKTSCSNSMFISYVFHMRFIKQHNVLFLLYM